MDCTDIGKGVGVGVSYSTGVLSVQSNVIGRIFQQILSYHN